MAQPVHNRHLYEETPTLLTTQLQPVRVSPDITLDTQSVFEGLPPYLYGFD